MWFVQMHVTFCEYLVFHEFKSKKERKKTYLPILKVAQQTEAYFMWLSLDIRAD